MISEITRIDRWMAANRPEYFLRLQSGVSGQLLDAFESRFSLRLPDAFRELYRWRNGQSMNSSDNLLDNWMFMSLEDIGSAKAELDGCVGCDFDDPDYWRVDWVPFLHNGGGSYLCIDLSNANAAPGRLIEFWKNDVERPVNSPSLKAWLNHLANAMENGTLNVL